MQKNTIHVVNNNPLQLTPTEKEVQSTWAALQVAEKQREKRGKRFGEALSKLREETRAQGSRNGGGFEAALRKLQIPASTAYYWINQYEGKEPPPKLEEVRSVSVQELVDQAAQLNRRDQRQLINRLRLHVQFEEVFEVDDDAADDELAAEIAANMAAAEVENDFDDDDDEREGDYDISYDSSVPPAVIDAARKIISTGYRGEAKTAHPDHGGSESDMQNLNAAKDWLRKYVDDEVKGEREWFA